MTAQITQAIIIFVTLSIVIPLSFYIGYNEGKKERRYR